MTHLSWYRKYRPQSFNDVVGQTHIERTLRNAVAENAVAHAYLFTGPRGTGKTTTARILAKALNCEKGPTPDPDETCEQCIAIAEGTHPDVHELDAASRTGVDDVREQIIGRVNYAPSRGGWKLYIIDEVHMLSASAFNALLKTIEEPPSHTVFILCTTHPHKVPETIHSRCQRFDFHRLSVEDIVSRLRTIADAEGVNVPDSALTLIGRHALGGMRDAITTLEQLASFGGGAITLEDVEGLLGEVDAELLFQAAELVLERDVAGAFRFVARLAEGGVDMSEFVKALVRHFRDLFVIAAVGADAAVDTTARDLGRLESQAGRFGADRVARVLDLLGRLQSELRTASDQRLAVEVALTRMARPQADITLESLAERLDALEAGTPLRDVPIAEPASPAVAAASKQPAAAANVGTPEATPETVAAPAEAPRPHASAQRGPLDVATLKRAWPGILAEFKKLKPSRSHSFNGTEAEVEDDTLIVEFPADQQFIMELVSDSETLALLRRSVSAVLGVDPPVEYRLGRAGRSGVKAPTAPQAAPAELPAPQAAEADPVPVDPVLSTDEATDLEASVIADLGAEVLEDVTPDS
ncbi:MAG: DNA polymerase III subunit gamma/tau [Coriobacteriia bacterium]|nr:DNA polymerase III subunit gamma/tau [Coriobacteriia bacterium]